MKIYILWLLILKGLLLEAGIVKGTLSTDKLGTCQINQEYLDGNSLEHTNSVLDKTKSISKVVVVTVIDYQLSSSYNKVSVYKGPMQESVISSLGHKQYYKGYLREAFGASYGAWIDLSVVNSTLQQSVIGSRGHIQYQNGYLREAFGASYGAWMKIKEAGLEYTCPSGYTLKDSKCEKKINYNIYEYTCPAGYKVLDNGLSVLKFDPDVTADNQTYLSQNINNQIPPLGNCVREIPYKTFEYICKDEVNTQGYNWIAKDIGIIVGNKVDRDENIVNPELGDNLNSIIPPVDNCSRSQKECPIECSPGTILDPILGVCYESYSDECSRYGLIYDSNASKCAMPNEVICPDGTFLGEFQKQCVSTPECVVVDGKCAQPKEVNCEEGFTYNELKSVCEKNIDCLDTQIANKNSEYCQSVPRCKDGDKETTKICIKETRVPPIACVPNERNGNTCFANNSGSEEIVYKKPLVKHDITGSGLSPDGFGIYNKAICNKDSVCKNGIDKVEGLTGILCFGKTNGERNCIEANECKFEGTAQTNSYFTSMWIDGKYNISFQDKDGAILVSAVKSTCELAGAVGYRERVGPIVNMKISGSKLEFWNSYTEEGYLGEILIPPSVAIEDFEVGYKIEDNTLWKLRDDGFGYIDSHDTYATYAVSNREMSSEECSAFAVKYGYSEHISEYGIPSLDRIPFDIVMNTTGGSFGTNSYIRYYAVQANICESGTQFNQDTLRCGDLNTSPLPSCPANTIEQTNGICYIEQIRPSENKCVLVKYGIVDNYEKQKWAVKTAIVKEKEYICSPMQCGNDGSCQTASCAEDYKGDIFSPSRIEPLATDCIDEVCDANKAYYEWCAKEENCPVDIIGISKKGSDCVKTICAEGGFNNASGQCFKWDCPEGYIDDGGKCVEE